MALLRVHFPHTKRLSWTDKDAKENWHGSEHHRVQTAALAGHITSTINIDKHLSSLDSWKRWSSELSAPST